MGLYPTQEDCKITTTLITQCDKNWISAQGFKHKASRPVHTRQLAPETRSRVSTPTSTHEGHDEGVE